MKTLNVKLSMAASMSTLGSVSLDCTQESQKKGVLCMPLFCKPLGIQHL